MIDAMITGKLKTPLLIVTENLRDIPNGVLNHCNIINNLEEQETFPLENEPQ